jgi:hypothetical protein
MQSLKYLVFILNRPSLTQSSCPRNSRDVFLFSISKVPGGLEQAESPHVRAVISCMFRGTGQGRVARAFVILSLAKND